MNRQTVQKIGMVLFMVFIAFQILTPPSNNNVYHAPNGTQQARLKTFYYTEGIPSYKVYTRSSGTPSLEKSTLLACLHQYAKSRRSSSMELR